VRKDHKDTVFIPFYSDQQSGFVQIVLTIVIVLMAVAAGYGIFLLRKQEAKIGSIDTIEQRLKAAEASIQVLSQQIKKDKINLTIPGVQRINNDFLVTKLSVEKYLTGVKIRGAIINSTALEQNDAKFRISIGEKLTEFTVKRIKPGSSTSFVADILDIPFERATHADFDFIASSVSYFVD